MDLGINPDTGRENLVWAPNRGHTIIYAQNVLNALRTATTKREAALILKQQARAFIEGTNLYKLLP